MPWLSEKCRVGQGALQMGHVMRAAPAAICTMQLWQMLCPQASDRGWRSLSSASNVSRHTGHAGPLASGAGGDAGGATAADGGGGSSGGGGGDDVGRKCGSGGSDVGAMVADGRGGGRSERPNGSCDEEEEDEEDEEGNATAATSGGGGGDGGGGGRRGVVEVLRGRMEGQSVLDGGEDEEEDEKPIGLSGEDEGTIDLPGEDDRTNGVTAEEEAKGKEHDDKNNARVSAAHGVGRTSADGAAADTAATAALSLGGPLLPTGEPCTTTARGGCRNSWCM